MTLGRESEAGEVLCNMCMYGPLQLQSRSLVAVCDHRLQLSASAALSAARSSPYTCC